MTPPPSPADATTDDPLSSLHFLSDAVFLTGCSDGGVYVVDVRASRCPRLCLSPPLSSDSALWWAEPSMGPPPCRVLRVSSLGRMLVSDLRSPGDAVGAAQLDATAVGSGVDDVRASWAPALDGCIAVTGR